MGFYIFIKSVLPLNILITGVAGFLGSHLSEALLAQNHLVTGIDNFDSFYSEKIKRRNLSFSQTNSNFTFYQSDITNSAELNAIPGSFDIVIHIAAKAGVLPSIQNPVEYVDTNITGTINILEFIKIRSIRKYIFASSSSIYGNNTEVPFQEDQKVDQPISPYAFSKKCGELMNFTYSKLYNIDCLNLRLFTLYGPRQRPDLSIHKFTRLIDQGKPIEMYGDGCTARDYTHVSDVVKGFMLSIDYLLKHQSVYEIFNIGNRNPIKLSDLISNIYSAMDIAPNIIQKPMQPGDVDVTFANISKATNILGYSPDVNFEDGLKDFVNWYKINKEFLT